MSFDSMLISMKEAIKRGLHVLITKPVVKTLAHHLELMKLAKEKNVLVAIEFHKRWDPIYAGKVKDEHSIEGTRCSRKDSKLWRF